MKMNNFTIPPLGARPAFLSASARITELAEAIARTSSRAENYVDYIERWAREILAQVNIMREFAEYDHQKSEYMRAIEKTENEDSDGEF